MAVIADLRNGAKTALDNTASLAQRYTARPASVGAYPAGWVDEARLDFNHDAGTRQWSGAIDCYLVVSSFDNEEEMTALDTATGQLADYVTDTPHVCGANTVIEPVSMRLTSVDFGDGVPRPAAIVTLGRFVFQEGR
jgi:hypothetical protein